MDSVVRFMTSSSIITEAEKVVEAENQRLTADEKKRRLLSFGPTPTRLQVPVTTGVVTVSRPPDDTTAMTDVVTSGDTLQSTPSGVPLGNLSPFETTANVFIRHAGPPFVQKFFDMANKYDMLNSEGTVIYYAGESMERFGAGKRRGRAVQFDVSVLLPDGTPVLNIVARKGITTISDFQKVIGTVIDTSTMFSSSQSYSVRDWNMCEIFQLKKSANGPPEEFDIVSTKEPMKLGLFTNNWSATVPNYIGVDKLYGISFPLDMCTEEKAILVGALFMLYFQHLHEGAGEVEKKRKSCLFGSLILIGILLLIGIFGIVIWGVFKK